MKIRRKGHKSFHGWNRVELHPTNVRWDKKKKVIEITSDDIGDFRSEDTESVSRRARHDYLVELSREEVGNILKVIGEVAIS